MKDVSIEYAHIYTNDKINDEHETSIELLDQTTSSLNRENKTFSLCVLVDDYSFPDPTFDYDSFTAWLTEKGFKPDKILRESQLIPLCDEVLSKVTTNKLKSQITNYVQEKKYPCSLFIAAWYLLRLGKIKNDLYPEELIAERLHNILPESFKPYEDQGLLIMASAFPNSETLVDYAFIKGRGLK